MSIPGAVDPLLPRLVELFTNLSNQAINEAALNITFAQETVERADQKAEYGKALVHLEKAQACLAAVLNG